MAKQIMAFDAVWVKSPSLCCFKNLSHRAELQFVEKLQALILWIFLYILSVKYPDVNYKQKIDFFIYLFFNEPSTLIYDHTHGLTWP